MGGKRVWRWGRGGLDRETGEEGLEEGEEGLEEGERRVG